MNMLPGLAASQYALVYNVLSFAIASMLASFVFFLAARQQVGVAYRPALLFSALVVGIAGYHYLRIFDSFESAYTIVDGAYAPSGKPFNDAYRYVDWFLTVPLLLVELVAVLHLSKAVGRSMLIKLIIAAVLMIGLGYPGETEYTNMTMRAVWGTLSSIPFVYILYVLWVQLGAQVKNESAEVRNVEQDSARLGRERAANGLAVKLRQSDRAKIHKALPLTTVTCLRARPSAVSQKLSCVSG
jgi:bacteriorhodopsin